MIDFQGIEYETAFELIKYLSGGNNDLGMLKDMDEAGGNPGDCVGYCNLEAPAHRENRVSSKPVCLWYPKEEIRPLCALFSWGRSEMVLVSLYEGLRVERHALPL